MTNIGLILFFFFLLVVCFALIANRDIFSPTKWFLATLGVYFSDIFFSVYIFEIYVIYFIILLAITIFIDIERKLKPSFKSTYGQYSNIKHGYSCRYNVVFMVLFIPSLFAQFYLINLFGGIEAYINIIGMRVVEFRGLGPVIVIKNSYFMIFIIYFMFYITKKNRKYIDFLFFGLALSGTIIIGLLSGSRGTLLLPFVYLLVIYHYLKRPIPVAVVVIALCLLLSTAAVLSVARSGYKMLDGTITTGISADNKASFSFSYYGLLPLEIVLNEQNRKLHYGSTFFTIFTNFIPRKIWPEKPDTGGVVLTKEYTGDAWEGSSNLSTGLISENVINFGNFGVVTGILMIVFMVLFSVSKYSLILLKLASESNILTGGFSFLYYFTIIRFLPSFLFAEFTSASMKLILSIIVILVVHKILKISFSHRLNLRFIKCSETNKC